MLTTTPMTLSDITAWTIEIIIAAAFVFFIAKAIVRKKTTLSSIGLAFVAMICLVISPFFLEDILFFKEDARIKLKENNIVLHDDFKILSHEIVGLSDMAETFELRISTQDKNRITQEIVRSPYFTDSINADSFYTARRGLTRRIFCDNENTTNYQRQSFQKLRWGYVYDLDRITISKTGNKLLFAREND